MTQAKKDNNGIPVILGTSNVDGETPTPVKADPTTHSLEVDDDTTGSDLSDDIASRDNNGVTVMMAVSETDGVTPTALYTDPTNGKLLIDSN